MRRRRRTSPRRRKPAPAQTPVGMQAEKPKAPPAAPRKPAASERLIPIGRRYERSALGDPVTLATDLLPRHIAVLAGPGSGKTVLLHRIVEEAALLGIPSIVVDPNNDLSRLGDAWPTRPESWSEEDAAKAETYRACADVVIWAPGVTSGNPISLNLLPDFAAIDDADEREKAIGMAWATLIPFLPGGDERWNRKKGVLADAIRCFAAGRGGTLTDLIASLAELPDDVSEDSNAQKLASEIADQLRAAIAMNPLLKSIGEPLDPKTLFKGPSGKTRVSVINLAGLASEEARDSFVNRLQMSLFTFIKRNPNPTGCLYVIDEAQSFAPSGAGTACKASGLSLAAQARKYGLGMMFATQTPKAVDNKIVSNCTTHVYGRMNAPATIDAIHDLMAAKGGATDDIGKLSKGEFYFSTEGSLRPFKVRTSLCLSWHPPSPPTAEEVIQKARSKRG
jgi:Helicase HerA, central domain